MKKLLDYIYNEPPRVLLMLGINLEAFHCLIAQVEKAQNAHQNEQEAEKVRINRHYRKLRLSIESGIFRILLEKALTS